MKKKVISMLLCMVMTVSLATGCAGGGSKSKDSSSTDPASPSTEYEESIWKDVVDYGPVDGKSDKDYSFGGVFGAINSYSDPMQGAANEAAKELGIPETEFDAPKDWIQNDQNTILDGLIAKGLKGIYMMTSDPVAGNEQISKMVGSGVPVVCVGGSPDTPSQATLTLATDVYQASYDGTKNLIEAMGGKGGVVGLCGAVTDTNTQSRMKAIEDACDEYPDVKLVQIIGDIDESEASVTAVENILAAKGDQINGFISTCYYPSVALASILSDEKYSEIHAIGCDTDEAVLDGIRSGALDGTMSQNPWGQAYLATVTLKMLTDGWTYEENEDFLVDSGSFYITQENVDKVEQTQKEATMEMAKTWTDKFKAPSK
ncbi:MAG: substrate-binding domain-containing protein [Faecalicatena sp.]|uniref:sugar ABC transporter substrate-binding protein n=1 Tax=Faecalicatena sp. TaxID=2005360 RepID=UPI00258D9115|nr:substrate-binding domain-containing protein [Faecalicatena sp.]MCI6467524.1 substrate-binding domain-containing protein [Faecalicatena sp.]MDY5619700.1 substrate-binding domain-containing protein [Lachnospiraceae bacterium]